MEKNWGDTPSVTLITQYIQLENHTYDMNLVYKMKACS